MAALPSLSAVLVYKIGETEALLNQIAWKSPVYVNPIRHILWIRLARDMWVQYKEDRQLGYAGALNCDAAPDERNLFLRLLLIAHEDNDELADAISAIKRAILPTRMLTYQDSPHNAANEEEVFELGLSLRSQTWALALPDERLTRILLEKAMVGIDDDEEVIAQDSNCWAINLAVALSSDQLGLSTSGLPFPALFKRELFRSDLDLTQKVQKLFAFAIQACDLVQKRTLGLALSLRQFEQAFPSLRSNSKLLQSWEYLYAFGELSPAQLAAILTTKTGIAPGSLTEPGARRLLKQLEDGGFARKSTTSSSYTARNNPPPNAARLDWLKSYAEVFGLQPLVVSETY